MFRILLRKNLSLLVICYLTNHNLSLGSTLLNEIEKEMVEASLFAWPRERPERCAMASVAFSEVADQVAAIAAAMAAT